MVEILIATYNGERYLEQQLLSLFKQTNTNFKITIRDDGSSDNTINIIEDYIIKYGSKIKFLNDDNKHLGSTLSFGSLISAATEDYIMLCDQDDYWLDDKIEVTLKRMIELEKKYQELPLLVFTDLKEVDENLKVLSKSFFKNQKLFPSISDSPLKLVALNVVAGCTVMINKMAKEFILPIPASNIIHDQWIAINIAEYGKISYLTKPTMLYRQHTKNAVGANKISFSYFLNKILKPYKQILIYKNLISNLNFKISIIGFIYYKIVFTLKRL